MDIYDYSFFLSTMWVGPFWFAMLVFPEHELTKKVMQETTVAQPSEEEMVQQQRQQAAYQAEVRAASRARSMAAFGH